MSPSTDNIVIIFGEDDRPKGYRVFFNKDYADGWAHGFTSSDFGDYAVTLAEMLDAGWTTCHQGKIGLVFSYLGNALAPVSTGDR